MEVTLDYAIELLEITDISKITDNDLSKITKKARSRWHPDRVAHLKNIEITKEYEEKSKSIDVAIQLIKSFIDGNYHAGQKTQNNQHFSQKEPEEVIRENAVEMQNFLKKIWEEIVIKKYKYTQEEVTLSDGFKLKDLLNEDFKEDIAMLSIIAFFYGTLFFMPISAVLAGIHPILGYIGLAGTMMYMISCTLGFLPLSRFWLNPQLSDVTIKLINFGLSIYRFAYAKSQNLGDSAVSSAIKIMVVMPELFAKMIKYVFLFPLYKIAELIIGNKVVGIVKSKVNYYAQIADWYILELLNKNSNSMSSDELFSLSHLYSELSDVRSYTPYYETEQEKSTNSNDKKEKQTNNRDSYDYQSEDYTNKDKYESEESNKYEENLNNTHSYTNKHQTSNNTKEEQINNQNNYDYKSEDNINKDNFENNEANKNSENLNNTHSYTNEYQTSNDVNENSHKNQEIENKSTEIKKERKQYSTLKTALISIFSSILICGVAFFIYTQYFQDDSIRDAEKAFSYIQNQNSNYYKEKEKIYKEFLKSFANSNTYNSEINIKLENDLVVLENENKQNTLETNKAINELRDLYSFKKGSLADFDYAFASYKESYKNSDSINILPLEQKVQKLISTFSETHFINDNKIKFDLTGKDIIGWGKIEAKQITSIISNIEKRNNATICIASLSLENNAVKSNAEVTINYNDTILVSVITNKITYKNTATPNSWFTFAPVTGCSIFVNTNNNPIQLKTCENCAVIKMNTNAETAQKLINHPETIYITSDTNFDAIVDFTYIPEK